MKRGEEIKIGDVFGDLTVIGEKTRVKKPNESRFYFLVACRCGNTNMVSSSNLRTGKIVSCKDCSFKRRSLNSITTPQLVQLYNHRIIQRSKGSSIEYSITLKEFGDLVSQHCHYCGAFPISVPLFLKRKYVNNNSFKANGIDRKDNTKGYTVDNCVPCCILCNRMKMDLSYDDFLDQIKKINAYYGK